jgi:hypothetical protein
MSTTGEGANTGVRLGIMQPYFLPYIGYFQLIDAVDVFVVYDRIKYTKKGWINRNRMLRNGESVMFSLPLKHDSDHLDVCERELAQSFDRDKLLSQFEGAYRRAPQFARTFPLLEAVVRYEDVNLFRFLHHSIVRMCAHLGIGTEIRVASEIAIDHGLKGQDKVLALCAAAGAGTYVNAIGGTELYAKRDFEEQSIALTFVRPRPFEYPQFGDVFVPWLSIVDVLMFNALDDVRACISTNYDLI